MEQEEESIINDWDVLRYNYSEFKRVNRLGKGMTEEEIQLLIDFLRDAEAKLQIVEEASYSPNTKYDFTNSEILWHIYNSRNFTEEKQYSEIPELNLEDFDWDEPVSNELKNALVIHSYLGNEDAQFILGELYNMQRDKEDKQLLETLIVEADKGDAEAQYKLAILYDEGIGGERDREKSMIYLSKALENNHPEAVYLMSKIVNFPDPCKKGMELLKKAAELGHPKAIADLESM